MPRSTSGNTSEAAGRSSRILVFLIVAAAIVGPAIAGYVLRQTILDSLTQIREGILTVVGLGFVPMSLWIGAFALTLVFRRSWLSPFNLWISAMVLVME